MHRVEFFLNCSIRSFSCLFYFIESFKKVPNGHRQRPPLDELPAHRWAQYEHAWVWYLARGYLGIVLKVFWHLPSPAERLSFVYTEA